MGTPGRKGPDNQVVREDLSWFGSCCAAYRIPQIGGQGTLQTNTVRDRLAGRWPGVRSTGLVNVCFLAQELKFRGSVTRFLGLHPILSSHAGILAKCPRPTAWTVSFGGEQTADITILQSARICFNGIWRI